MLTHLGFTVFQPVIGSFSDIFGRKALVYLSLVFFLIGAILAAVAHNTMTLLLVGRSIQGVGGGGVLVLTEIIVTDLVPAAVQRQLLRPDCVYVVDRLSQRAVNWRCILAERELEMDILV